MDTISHGNIGSSGAALPEPEATSMINVMVITCTTTITYTTITSILEVQSTWL